MTWPGQHSTAQQTLSVSVLKINDAHAHTLTLAPQKATKQPSNKMHTRQQQPSQTLLSGWPRSVNCLDSTMASLIQEVALAGTFWRLLLGAGQDLAFGNERPMAWQEALSLVGPSCACCWGSLGPCIQSMVKRPPPSSFLSVSLLLSLSSPSWSLPLPWILLPSCRMQCCECVLGLGAAGPHVKQPSTKGHVLQIPFVVSNWPSPSSVVALSCHVASDRDLEDVHEVGAGQECRRRQHHQQEQPARS